MERTAGGCSLTRPLSWPLLGARPEFRPLSRLANRAKGHFKTICRGQGGYLAMLHRKCAAQHGIHFQTGPRSGSDIFFLRKEARFNHSGCWRPGREQHKNTKPKGQNALHKCTRPGRERRRLGAETKLQSHKDRGQPEVHRKLAARNCHTTYWSWQVSLAF